MSIDYIVSSLPTLSFNAPAPISWDHFEALCGGVAPELPRSWIDLETQLRNALAEARGGSRFKHPAEGCALYWKNRILSCFQEKDILTRDRLIDQIWWDAAGELTDVTNPLGLGALQTYSVRLKIAIKRSRISREIGNAAFDKLTQETKR